MSDEQTAPQQVENPQQSAAILYTKVEPLTPDLHKDLGLKKLDRPLSFAKDAHIVPLNAVEFNFASKHFPIVFTGTDVPMPVAVLGMQDKENLFISPDGSWPVDVYTPAYLRRVPFIFGRANDDETKLTLCIDRNAPMISDQPDVPFFQDGDLSEAAKNALEFCKSFHQHYTATLRLGELLKKYDLFTNQQVNMRGASGQQHVVGTYVAVDEKKLNEMSEGDFAELRKANILPFIYMHLSSLSNWQRLSTLRKVRLGEPFPPTAPTVQ